MYCHFLSLGLHSTMCTSTQVIIFATEHLLTINYKFSVYSNFLDLLKCYMYSSAMCSSRKFPKEEIFDTPPCLEIELKLQTFLKLFFSFETPPPPPHCGISNPFYLVGGWIFSGTTQIRVYARI